MKHFFDNPVYWLDLRSRVREKRLWVLASFFLAVPLVISLLVLFNTVDSISSRYSETGMTISGIAIFFHGALLTLLSALGAAQRISQERERRTLPALANSPLAPAKIADGKLLGAWIFTAWLACLTLPFLATGTLWGGLSAWALLAAWCLNLAAAMATSALALGLSGLFGRSLSAYLATGAVLFLWCAVVPIISSLFGTLTLHSGDFETMAYASCTFLHLPLAPQVWIFSDGMDGTIPGWLAMTVPLCVWCAIAALGRALAIRGLKREVY